MSKNLPMVPRILFGRGVFNQLDSLLAPVRTSTSGSILLLVDDVFRHLSLGTRIPVRQQDHIIWTSAREEPTTAYADRLTEEARALPSGSQACVVGIGGGSVLDLAKTVSLMLTNPGSSADYQGWDLIKRRAIYHVGIPTLSGTGAEVSRTAVLCGPQRKLGINSDYTVFDQIVLDPELIDDAPHETRFYTGMDCYIHCVESLHGTMQNPFSAVFGEKGLDLCRQVFLSSRTTATNDRLMMASLCGGISIGYSQVGAVHALSYGLSYILGLRHGPANCVAFQQLDSIYGTSLDEFRCMLDVNRIQLPCGVTAGLPVDRMEKMIDVALSMTPLWENALGPQWRSQMPRSRVKELYSQM